MSDIKKEYIGSDVSFSDSECNKIYTVPTKFRSTSKNKASNQSAIQEEELCYQNEVNLCLPDLHDIYAINQGKEMILKMNKALQVS